MVFFFYTEYRLVNQRYEKSHGTKFNQQNGETEWNDRSNTQGTDDVVSTGR